MQKSLTKLMESDWFFWVALRLPLKKPAAYWRRYILMKNKFKKILKILVLCIIIFIIFICVVSILPMGNGSESYALKWSAKLEDINSVEEAYSKHSNIYVKNFDNGEWVFGVSSDSHSNPWGGTIVLKDSNGKIRSYFGHVCGSGFLKRLFKMPAKNLNTFYTTRFFEFKEYDSTKNSIVKK